MPSVHPAFSLGAKALLLSLAFSSLQAALFFYNAGADAWRNWNGGTGGFTLNMSGGTFDAAVIQVWTSTGANNVAGPVTVVIDVPDTASFAWRSVDQ